MLKFIKFLNHERLVYTDYTENNYRCVHKGVMQGGVLSPLLYILYVTDITTNVKNSISVSQFADDLAIYIKCKSVVRGKKMIENAAKMIHENLQNIGLNLSPQKSILLHFNNKNILPGSIEIKINDIIIKSQEIARFLGVLFDYKLSFIPQINSVKQKCSRSLNILKFLCGTWWGSSPDTLLTIYKSYIRPIIEYGSFVYYPTRNVHAKKLEKIQYSALRTSLGFRNSTPTNILIAESKFMLLKDRIQYLCECYLAKILTNNSSLTYKNIIRFHYIQKKNPNKKNRLLGNCISSVMNFEKLLNVQDNYYIYKQDYETLTTSVPFDKKVGMSLKQNLNANEMLNDFIQNKHAYSIYTDGSKMLDSNSVGAACICPQLEVIIKRSLNKHASIFTAECIALNDALDVALQIENQDNRNILVFSDSLSALQALESIKVSMKTNPYIYSIKAKYCQFIRENQGKKLIQLYWLPSHVGIRGNEEADSAAKNATHDLPNNLINIPFTDLYEFLYKKAKNQSTYTIEQEGKKKGKTYFESFYSKNKLPWYTHITQNRSFITTINRMRANHYHLSASLFRIGIINSPQCQCGHESEDLNHIIWQCKRFDHQRKALIKNLSDQNLTLPLSIEMLIAKPNLKACESIYKFLKYCNLNI